VLPDRVHADKLATLLPYAVDDLLEATIVGSFSRLGAVVRRRLWGWAEPPRMDGKVIVVTGASSGIGRSVALTLARLGADLMVVGRDEERLEATRRSAATFGAGRVESAALDLVDADAVSRFVTRLTESESHIDGLVHGAGALFSEFRTAPNGTELTLATHVLAPFRLSCLLRPLLRRAPSSIIVTISSGGMYTQRFDLGRLELTEDAYRGVTAYARAKRAQVVLAHEWARRWVGDGVASYVMHPGWVDTPGLTRGLPSFARLGPLLRTADEGADTTAWLAAGGDRECAGSAPSRRERSDGIWLDRRRRSEFHLPWTYRSPTQQRRDGGSLWEWCGDRTAPDVASDHP
jgi:dehydrogenase/reductase SDR family member 12